MPVQAPYTTGNDILSYRGDPGLAAGAGTGLSPITVNPLAGLDTTLDRIQEQNHREALLDYQQKLQRQEDLRKMLSETGGSVFNMKSPQTGQNMSFTPLPEDAKVLNQKALEQRKLIIANPDNYWFNEDYQKNNLDLNQLTSEAGMRATAYGQYNQDLLKSNDPDEQTDIKNLRDSEIHGHKLGEGYMPEPFLPKPVINEGNLIDAKALADENNWNPKEYIYYEDGNEIRSKISTLSPNVGDFRQTLTPGSKGYTDAVQMSKSYLKTIATNPQFVQSQNQQIDALNKAYGYTNAQGQPVNPHYIPHIADIVTQQDGTPRVRVNTADAATVAYALMMERHGTPKTGSKVDTDAGDIESGVLDDELKRSEIAKNNAAAKGKTGKPPTGEELKEEQNKQAALSAYHEVSDVFNGSYPKSVIPLPGATIFKDGTKLSDYNIYSIPGAVANKFIGIEAPENKDNKFDKATGKVSSVVTTNKGESLTPDAVALAENKKTKEKRLIYFSQGKLVSEATPKQAMVNSLKHDARYQPSEYENKTPWVDQVYNNGGKAETSTGTSAAPVNNAPPKQNFTPKYNGTPVSVRRGTSGPEAQIGGVWKKIVGKNPQTGELIIR